MTAGYQVPPQVDPEAQRQRNWAMAGHLASLATMLVVFGGLIGTIIIYSLRKDDVPYVSENARKALNAQITVTLVMFLCLGLVLAGYVGLIASGAMNESHSRDLTTGQAVDIGLIFLTMLPMFAVMFGSMAWAGVNAFRAYNGAIAGYPYAIPFVKKRP